MISKAEGWWRTAVVYEVYIRSFADGNGDGTGDIAGIRERLPYIRRLGADAIWITPWYVSPMADGGYDIIDHYSIAPEFGTLEDAGRLIKEAHAMGLRVILDLVPNHTSTAHPWFQELLEDPENADAASRYWVRDGRGADGQEPPNNWRSVFGGPAWSALPQRSDAPKRWYLHLFAPEQADLNWGNAEVQATFERILRFWFDRGVDGMRIDVAHGLSKDPQLPDIENEALQEAPTITLDPDEEHGSSVEQHPFWDRDENHHIFKTWRRIAESYASPTQEARIFVAEAWRIRQGGLYRYVGPDELNLAFNFDLINCGWTASEYRQSIERHLAMLARVDAPATWVLSSHDFIRPASRLGFEGDWHSVRGDVSNVTGDIQIGLRRARAAALLTLALPGSAYIYQGDELGLPEVLDLPETGRRDPIWRTSEGTARGRDGCRVPFPWTEHGPSLGFGRNVGWLPQPAEWRELAATSQCSEPGSTLMLYRQAIALRPALQHAASTSGLAWSDGHPDVLAFHYGDAFACIVNFGECSSDLPEGWSPLLSSVPQRGCCVAPNSAVWLVKSE